MSRAKIWRNMIIAAVLFAAAPLHARVYQTVPPNGPMKVGVRIETIALPGRAMPALVWYPAKDGSGSGPYLYNTNVQGYALRDAEPERARAPYPLIVFSHGMGGCAPQHVFINENLASHGFVVIAPDHAEAAMCHIAGPPEISPARMTWVTVKHLLNLSGVVMDLFGDMMAERGYDFSYRPAEIKATIDAALAWNDAQGHFLAGMIAPDRIGMAGHSLGGFTTLMIAGMPFLCGGGPPPAEACSLENIGLENIPDPCCFDYVKQGNGRAFADPRVKAVLIMSPAILYSRVPEAAAELRVPIMLINGDKIFEVPWGPVEQVYENAPGPKYLIKLKQADHMTAADSTLAISAARVALPGFIANFDAKARAYQDLSAAFFNRHLKGDESMSATLGRSENKFVIMRSERD